MSFCPHGGQPFFLISIFPNLSFFLATPDALYTKLNLFFIGVLIILKLNGMLSCEHSCEVHMKWKMNQLLSCELVNWKSNGNQFDYSALIKTENSYTNYLQDLKSRTGLLFPPLMLSWDIGQYGIFSSSFNVANSKQHDDETWSAVPFPVPQKARNTKWGPASTQTVRQHATPITSMSRTACRHIPTTNVNPARAEIL